MYYFSNKLKFIFSDCFPSTANTIHSFLFSTVENFEHVQTFQLIKIHSFLQGWTPPPFLWEPSPFLVPPLSVANLKKYPLFLRAIQIGTCKL